MTESCKKNVEKLNQIVFTTCSGFTVLLSFDLIVVGSTDALKAISAGGMGEAQRKFVEEDPGQTLAQQENMQISGSQARHMVMQKLMRKTEVKRFVAPNINHLFSEHESTT